MTACARPRLLALCDFNGTIVDRDMLVVLASQAGADPSPYEQGTRADIDRLAQLLTIGRDEAERRIERGVQFDASFGSFVRACAGAGVLLVVVSSGIRELIERYLARRGIYLPLYASEAEMRSDGWRMRFHDDSPSGIDRPASFGARNGEAAGRLSSAMIDLISKQCFSQMLFSPRPTARWNASCAKTGGNAGHSRRSPSFSSAGRQPLGERCESRT